MLERIASRTYYSIQHIRSAANFTRHALDIEEKYIGSNKDGLLHKHQSYVTGAIFTSVAFLEATINEIFMDTSDSSSYGELEELGEETLKLMNSMWEVLSHSSTLNKFQKALVLTNKASFDKGSLPYQDVDLLIKLRNALTHYEPQTIITHLVKESKINEKNISKNLKGKFELNPLIGAGASYFPHKILSYGCSKWAVNSSLNFTDEFFKKIKINPTYDHVRDDLSLI